MTKSFLPVILCCLLPAVAFGQTDFPLSFGNTNNDDPVGELEVVGEIVPVEPGFVDLKVKVTLPANSYIYSQTTPYGIASALKILSEGVEPIGGMKPNKPYKTVRDTEIGVVMEKFYDKVTWTQRLRITDPGIQAGGTIEAELSGQFCNDESHVCVPIEPPAAIAASIPSSYVSAKVGKPAGVSSVTVVPDMRPPAGLSSPPVRFDISLTPTNAKRGEYVNLNVTASVDRPYHIYSITLSEEIVGGTPTVIDVETSGLVAVNRSFVTKQKPESKVVPETGDILEYHHDKVTWTRQFVVEDEPVGVNGEIVFQLCNETSCLNPTSINFELGLNEPGSQAAVGNSNEQQELAASTEFGDTSESTELLTFIISAVTFGFIALMTPCVFPMIPVTISFFLKQSNDNPRQTIKLATVYCLGIIGAFTVLGLFVASAYGAGALTSIANDKWLNLFFAFVFTMFGLMLMGLFEFRMPSWLLTWTSKKQEAGGIIGVLFMALTFTLVSFTCTFAFVGQLLVWASNGEFLMPVIGMIAFSSAFASPFFLLALFPSMLRKLPKSGGWMNTVKVTMGLVELAVVAKFLSVADTGFSPTSVPMLLDYHLVMGGWVAISAITGLYLLGVFRMPHDSPVDSIGPIRCLFSIGFVGLAAYITVGLFSAKPPEGLLWQQIVAFAPSQIETQSGDDGYFTEHDGLTYALDFDAAANVATSSNKPMFLDFTGVNCINCRRMEKGVLSKSEIHSVLKGLVRVQLYVDLIPGVDQTTNDYDRLLKRNKALQASWFGDVTIPAYAITSPDGKQIMASFKGLDTTGTEFKRFLEAGLARWKSMDETASRSSAETSNQIVTSLKKP